MKRDGVRPETIVTYVHQGQGGRDEPRRTSGGNARPARAGGHGAGRRTRRRRADVGRPAVTLAEGTSARPPADSHVVVDAAGNATVAWVDQDGTLRRRRPRAGLDPPARRSVVGAPEHLRQRATSSTRSTSPPTPTASPSRSGPGTTARHRRARGRDPGPGGAWSAPVPVGDSTVDAETPQVGVDAAGNAVAHVDGEGPGRRTCAYATKPAGGSWSAADDVSDPAEGLGDQRLRPRRHPRRAGDRGVDACYLTMPTDRGHPGRGPSRRGAFGDPETISSADHEHLQVPTWR